MPFWLTIIVIPRLELSCGLFSLIIELIVLSRIVLVVIQVPPVVYFLRSRSVSISPLSVILNEVDTLRMCVGLRVSLIVAGSGWKSIISPERSLQPCLYLFLGVVRDLLGWMIRLGLNFRTLFIVFFLAGESETLGHGRLIY